MFLVLLLGIFASLIPYLCVRKWGCRQLESRNGCRPPTQVPHWDPFGLDYFLQTGKAIEEKRWFSLLFDRYVKFGNTFESKFFGSPTIQSCEPENIQSVFSTNAKDWGVSFRLAGFKDYAGRGFLTTDGPEWEHSRAALAPSLTKKNIWDHESYEYYLQLLARRIPKNRGPVDLQELIKMLYLDTSTLFLFGESFGSLEGASSRDLKLFLDSSEYAFGVSGFRIMLGPLRHFLLNSKFTMSVKTVHRIVSRYIDRAFDTKQQWTEKASQPPDRRYSMLDRMITQTSDRAAIRSTAIQSFIAAHDTTGFLISNIFWNLARHPAVWMKLRGQFIDRVGLHSELTFDHSQKVPYLRSVIYETLRLYPIFPWNVRAALVDTILPTGGGPAGSSPIFCRAGTWFDTNLAVLHRRKDIYGPDADVFRPERWEEFTPKTWQYVPFGGGPRACLGRQKALAETGYFVCRMMQEFESIEPKDTRDWAGDVKGTTSNANGCWVAFKPRGDT